MLRCSLDLPRHNLPRGNNENAPGAVCHPGSTVSLIFYLACLRTRCRFYPTIFRLLSSFHLTNNLNVIHYSVTHNETTPARRTNENPQPRAYVMPSESRPISKSHYDYFFNPRQSQHRGNNDTSRNQQENRPVYNSKKDDTFPNLWSGSKEKHR